MLEAAHNPQDLTVQALSGEADAVDGVRRLFQEVFDHEVSAAHWHWKYGPVAGAQSLNWVALGPEGPARPWGHVGARLMPGWWCGQRVQLAHLTDVMVHPQVRGNLQPNTVYARLMRTMAQALIDAGGPTLLAWGFPGLTPARLGARMGLYRPLQRLSLFHVNASSSEERQPPSGPQPLGPRISVWPPSGWRRASPLRCTVHAQAWDAAWLNHMWQRHAADSPAVQAPSGAPPGTPAMIGPAHLSVQKDAAYGLWRYRDHPAQPYRLWRVQGPWWRSLGWIVTRAEPQPLVVDILLPPQWRSGSAWSEVLRALSLASGCAQWTTWNAPDPGITPFETETSLIVPVEFRAAELAAGEPSPWTRAHSEARSEHHSLHGWEAAGTPPLPHPWFQPGDTDVF